MSTIIQKIDKSEFDRLLNCDETCYIHGCLFSYSDDNLIAFQVWKSELIDYEFYKVLNSN